MRATPAFAVAACATVVTAAVLGLMVSLMVLDVRLPGPLGEMTHFQEPHHRIHDLTFGFLFIPTVIGLLAQLRRPIRNVSGMVMALVPAAMLLLTLLITLVLGGDARVLQPPWVMVGAGVLITFSLHPAGDTFFRSFRSARSNRPMLALVLVAVVPLAMFAYEKLRLQSTIPDGHGAAGHYGFMAAFALTVATVGLLAALRADGWRSTAWVAGLLPAALGLSSFTYPQATSSLDPFWSLASIAWAAAFITTAELTDGRSGS